MVKSEFYFSQAAMDAFQARNFELAIFYWRQAQALTGSGSFEANIAVAERLNKAERDRSRPRIKIAAIMDTFSEASFRPECELLQLYPDRWKDQLQEFRPAFVFIESAWRGAEEKWDRKVSIPGAEILALLEFCHEQGLPTILWNKEDPPHFHQFFHIAERVDHVFTVDADMIPYYKKLLGHERVHLLPFFAQPRLFNPVEKYQRLEKLCFAGSWTPKYPQRMKEFTNIVNTLRWSPGVEIYDRNLGKNNPDLAFPEAFQELVKGMLPFDEIDRAYKGYKFALNMNSVKCSSTMFARRCYELLASNTIVLSNYARGLKNILGDLVIAGDTGARIQDKMSRCLASEHDLRRFRLQGLRKVLSSHTTAMALDTILEKLGLPAQGRVPEVTLLAKAANLDEKREIENIFEKQTWARLRLVIWQQFQDQPSGNPAIAIVSSWKGMWKAIEEGRFYGVISPTDYYGPNYVTDLILGSSYSEAAAFGKAAYFALQADKLELQNDGMQYRPWVRLHAGAAIWRAGAVSEAWLQAALTDPALELPGDIESQGVDEFSYIAAGASATAELKAYVEDLPLRNTGFDRDWLERQVERAREPEIQDILSLGPGEIAAGFTFPDEVKIEAGESALNISATLPEKEVAYCWSKSVWLKEQFPLQEGDILRLEGSGKLKLYLAIRLEDENRQKLLAANVAPGRHWQATFPEGTRYISMAFRIMGPGEYVVEKIRALPGIIAPPVIYGRIMHLFSEADIAELGSDKNIGSQENSEEIFILSNDREPAYGECEAGEYIAGSVNLFKAIIQGGSVAELHLHYLSVSLWEILEPYCNSLKIFLHVPDFRLLEACVGPSSRNIARKLSLYEFMEAWLAVAGSEADIEPVFSSEAARIKALEIREGQKSQALKTGTATI